MSKVSVKRHLKEIQWRLMLVALFFIAGAVLAYQFQEYLIPLLLNPLHGEKLVYLNPAGGFSFIFLISIYIGIALSFPVLVQQIYAFLRPVLPKSVQKKSAIIIFCSFLLMLSGIAFGYFIAVPNALAFLYGFADSYVEASLTAESYLNFVVGYTIGIGIVFQLPLLLMLRHSISPMKPGGLIKSEKWVFLGSFIVAAIITPTPDPVNQTIMAAPIIFIYQIGVIAVLISIAKAHRAQKKANKRAPLSNEQFQNLLVQPEVDETPLVLAPLTQATQLVQATDSPTETQSLQVPQTVVTELEVQATTDIQAALSAELHGDLNNQLENQFETELEAALLAEVEPQSIYDEIDLTPAPRVAPVISTADQPVAPKVTASKPVSAPAPMQVRPMSAPSLNRPAFRSIDGIMRQRVIKPQV